MFNLKLIHFLKWSHVFFMMNMHAHECTKAIIIRSTICFLSIYYIFVQNS